MCLTSPPRHYQKNILHCTTTTPQRKYLTHLSGTWAMLPTPHNHHRHTHLKYHIVQTTLHHTTPTPPSAPHNHTHLRYHIVQTTQHLTTPIPPSVPHNHTHLIGLNTVPEPRPPPPSEGKSSGLITGLPPLLLLPCP